MDYVLIMQVSNTLKKILHDLSGLLFRKMMYFLYSVKKISSIQQFHDNVDEFFCFKVLKDFDNVRMVNVFHYLYFSFYVLYFFMWTLLLKYYFYCPYLICFYVCTFSNFTVGSWSQNYWRNFILGSNFSFIVWNEISYEFFFGCYQF